MQNFSLEDISLKLVQIVKTRNEDQVRHWINVLEKQKDPMVTVTLFIFVSRHLAKIDHDLHRWFYELYFEGFEPEVKDMWLEFVDLCGMSV